MGCSRGSPGGLASRRGHRRHGAFRAGGGRALSAPGQRQHSGRWPKRTPRRCSASWASVSPISAWMAQEIAPWLLRLPLAATRHQCSSRVGQTICVSAGATLFVKALAQARRGRSAGTRASSASSMRLARGDAGRSSSISHGARPMTRRSPYLWAVARAEALGERTTRRPPARAADQRRICIRRSSTRSSRQPRPRRLAVCEGLERGVTEAIVLLSKAFASSAAGGVSIPARRGPARSVAHRHLSAAVPALCRGAHARAHVAPNVPRFVFDRGAARGHRARCRRRPDCGSRVQAITRLAHRGLPCRPAARDALQRPSLRAAQRAPGRDERRSAIDVLRRVLQAGDHGTHGPSALARRIAFADLGVEQLGTIYERVLDHRLVDRRARRARCMAPRGRQGRTTRSSARPRIDASETRLVGSAHDRKGEHHVLHAPPARGSDRPAHAQPPRDAAGKRRHPPTRVVDPAMGSGAFLVAACRYPGAGVRGGAGSGAAAARSRTGRSGSRAIPRD